VNVRFGSAVRLPISVVGDAAMSPVPPDVSTALTARPSL
jgi:hypothetical protein